MSSINDKNKIQYDANLEGLRGVLSLIVGISHVFGIKYILDPMYHPDLFWLNTGKSAVLMFFIMSGYVIGMTNQISYSHAKAKQYLLRRAVRLIPIYVFSVLLGVAIVPEKNVLNIFGNLLFLQNILVPKIEGNSPVWSVNYEIIYYLFFLLIWFFKPQLKLIFLFCLTISFLGFLSLQIPALLCAYASGFVFWLLGLCLAWRVEISSEILKVPILSYLFLFFSLHNFRFGSVILNGLGIADASRFQVGLSDLIGAMPICIVVIAVVTRRHFKLLKWINLFCFTQPALMLLFLLLKGRIFEERWIPAIFLYLLAFALIRWNFDLSRLASLAFFGRISYAFYLVHFPFILLLQDHFPLSGSLVTFTLRVFIWFFMSLSVSALLELIIQPAIRKWCIKNDWFVSIPS